jgi:hypothetical protein
VRLARAAPHREVARHPAAAPQIMSARAVLTAPLGGGSLLGMAQPGVTQ